MKHLTLLVLATAFLLQSYSQPYTYHKFPTSDDKPLWWEYHGNHWNSSENADYLWGMIGDTFIGNYNYSKLYRMNDTLLIYSNIKYYFAGIREDFSKRIFIVYNGETEEQLLFDFSKTVNDTIIYQGKYFDYKHKEWDSSHIFEGIVIRDDSNSQNLSIKGYRRLATYTSNWIFEGIGHTGSLFNPIYRQLESESDGLVAYKKGDSVCYGWPDAFSHYKSTIREVDLKDKINCFYDQFNNVLEIDMLNWNQSASLTIYNYNGKELKTVKLFENTINNADMSVLRSGLYLYNVIINNEKVSGKFVKAN